jgi:hypothetical protein
MKKCGTTRTGNTGIALNEEPAARAMKYETSGISQTS